MKSLLTKNGRLFIAGPAKDNNREFLTLIDNVSKIPNQTYQDLEFMEKVVLPFCKKEFRAVQIFNFSNPICFPNSGILTEYWKATSLYRVEDLMRFRVAADAHFITNKEFITTKRVQGVLVWL